MASVRQGSRMWWSFLLFCSSGLADFSQMNAKYFSLPMDILDVFTLPIIPGNILIILMSLQSFGLVASACKHCKIPRSSIPDQKFCLLCMTHITRDKTHIFSHLSKYQKKKKILITVFATEHKKYKVTNLHYLSCNVMELTAEVKTVGRALKKFDIWSKLPLSQQKAERKKCFT